MGRITKESGDFQEAPTGTHVARCYQIIDIGTHHGEFQGKPTTRNRVIIAFELSNELRDDGRPFSISRFYTNSLNEKAALRHDLQSWRGKAFTADELKGFDLSKVLGVPCMVTIIEDNGKTKLSTVTALPKGMAAPPAINKPFAFWIEDDWDEAGFLLLSEGLQKLIRDSDEYKARGGGNGFDPSDERQADADSDDSIPFSWGVVVGPLFAFAALGAGLVA